MRSSSPRWITTASSPRGWSSRTTRIWSSSTRAAATTRRSISTTSQRKLCPAHPGRRLRVGLQRDRHDRRRPLACAARPRWSARSHGSTPSTTPRTSRSTSRAIGADVLICSPYKFCGPHLGIAFGRAEVLEGWRPYKARPAPMKPARPALRDRHAALRAARRFNATIDYLDSIGGFVVDRSLRALARPALPRRHLRRGHRVRAAAIDGRVPTFLVNVDACRRPTSLARLAERSIGVWATTPGTRSTCTASATTTGVGSASSTTTRRKRSTAP